MNILFYLHLVTTCGMEQLSAVRTHPVIDRIMEWKKYTLKADSLLSHLQPTIVTMLARLASGKSPLGLVSETAVTSKGMTSKGRPTKRRAPDDDDFLNQHDQHKAAGDTADVYEGDGKRPINQEIARNKGLMPKRRRDLKHSRVKKRKNFEKALIRKRGQIPDVRRELTKYAGEARGINAGVTKSRKLH